VNDADCLRRGVDHLHVTASTKRAVERSDGIQIQTHAPVGGVFARDEGCAEANPILGRHAADGNMERMIGEQFNRTARNSFNAGAPAGLGHALALAPQVGLQRTFLSERQRG
jgi:hypothetical protein